MIEEDASPKRYPAGLLDWSGHRGGGVKKMFFESSSRPSSEIIRTGLLNRLESWAMSVGDSKQQAPTIILLVGGPGNGKTEAVEFAIRRLDAALACNGSLTSALAKQFLPTDGSPPPRLAEVPLAVSSDEPQVYVQIVQDASAGDSRIQPYKTPAQLLVSDLKSAIERAERVVYLACVNRGILDDALICSIDSRNDVVRPLLEQVVRSVGTGPKPIACWPLEGFSTVAVWPMDIESLLKTAPGMEALPIPAAQLLESATGPADWPKSGTCEAGPLCPFCQSREVLSGQQGSTSLFKILRWYELASGKRWSFRDLGSLFAYLLAGAPPEGAQGTKYSPCKWAAQQLALRSSSSASLAKSRALAPFLLVSRLHKHAPFGSWPKVGTRELKGLLKELELSNDEILSGLQQFLNDPRRSAIPPTLWSQLDEISEVLDPALADPDDLVELSGNTAVAFREIDIRFSQSVGEGLQYIQKYRCLTRLEIDLLRDLDGADKRLATAGTIKNRPEIAARVQSLLRDFACRLVRRSVGCRAAAVKDKRVLVDFELVVSGDDQLLYEASQQVERLLNSGDKFTVVLNTTFGEPAPSPERRVTFTTDKQRVKVPREDLVERPASNLKFLSVGPPQRLEFVTLTYELYKSLRELQLGMLNASLPRAVVALLDITRARLGGHIVRDEDLLEVGNIQIGVRKDVVVFQRGKFLVKRDLSA